MQTLWKYGFSNVRYLNWHETDLGILCILGSQVLVKIPNDVWCDLERAKEHEEQAEEDVQAADDQTLTHDDQIFSAAASQSLSPM